MTAKNEGIAVVECFCVCHFQNPSPLQEAENSPLSNIPLRSMFRLDEFGLELESKNVETPIFFPDARLLRDL